MEYDEVKDQDESDHCTTGCGSRNNDHGDDDSSWQPTSRKGHNNRGWWCWIGILPFKNYKQRHQMEILKDMERASTTANGGGI